MAIAPQRNPPITPWYYIPRAAFISAITTGTTTTITTAASQYYVVGQIVKLLLNANNGCRGLNNREFLVISVPSSTQVVLDVNSLLETPFVLTASYTEPQIVPVGDYNSGAINSQGRVNNGTYIQGSFINISPLGNTVWH